MIACMGQDASIAPHPDARRGRGAQTNASGRYESEARVAVDDGWGSLDEAPAPIATTVTRDTSRGIIARNNSPDIGFDRSINPYRGCEHGCAYCYARPTHAWLGLSPGLDFESRLYAKPEAAALLRRELRHPAYRCQMIALGTNTDPYQPIEREWRLTRQILEVLAECNHPVGITTKSNLVTRDIDVLAPMARARLANVFLSVTTLDRQLARRMEPRAATPERRLEAMSALRAAGIPVGVMVAPVIPGLNDHEMEAIMARAREAGASEAAYVVLRLPLEIKELWRDWLAANYPDRASRVMKLVREMRGGRDYDPVWGRRQTGTGPFAQLIGRRFRQAAKRLGLNEERAELDCSRFAPPPMAGDQLLLL
jgi:DNA repair photolyase